jgi:hypothetical protein
MPKKLKCTLFAISFYLLTSCAPNPPDVPACEHLGQHLFQDPKTGHQMLAASPTCMKQIHEAECGHCIYTITGRETFLGEMPGHGLNGKKWSQIRAESIYLPAVESYAPIKTYIVDACAKMNCNDQVSAFRVKINALNGIAGALGSGK